MHLPAETKSVLWGFVGGAIAAAAVGFTWGGWVTSGTAEASASQRSTAAVIAALAPVCVEKFQSGASVAANLTALKKAETWSQGEFVEKGGWAASPGVKAPEQVTAVARACAVLLAA
jgi:hypothetical protein